MEIHTGLALKAHSIFCTRIPTRSRLNNQHKHRRKRWEQYEHRYQHEFRLQHRYQHKHRHKHWDQYEHRYQHELRLQQQYRHKHRRKHWEQHGHDNHDNDHHNQLGQDCLTFIRRRGDAYARALNAHSDPCQLRPFSLRRRSSQEESVFRRRRPLG